jgi:hypothetical protein
MTFELNLLFKLRHGVPVPAIPIIQAQRSINRDHRDKPGDDI